MYEELKERCRACSQGCIYPSECSYFDKPPLRCMRQLLSEAADAIEELLPFKKQVEKGMGLLNKADELLNAIKPRWIPVTERLPEEAGYYITAFSKGEVGQNLYMTFADRSGKWYQNSEDTGEVTHWMPLPQPPKEE